MALSFKTIWEGLKLENKTTLNASEKGELEVDNSTGKLNYHDGSVESPVVTEVSSSTLTNKTLLDSTTIIADHTTPSKQIKFDAAGSTSTSTTLLSSQTVDRILTLPDVTGTLATTTDVGGVDTKVGNLVTLSGVAANSVNLGTVFMGTTIPDNSTNVGALQALETAHETTDAKVGHLITLSGMAASSDDLGTFTYGIIPAYSTDKGALQALETEIHTHEASTTAHGATGAIVGTTNTQTLTNKSLSDSTTAIVDVTDATKQIKFDAAGSTGTSTTLLSSQTANRTLTMPNLTGTLVTMDGAQALTNKTLDDTTTTIIDTSAPTKVLAFDVAGTAGFTTTLATSQTANRTLTLPDLTGTLVTTDGAQVLTNKDIDGGTATNTSRITLPSSTITTINGLTNKAGTVTYATDTKKVYFNDGTQNVQLSTITTGSSVTWAMAVYDTINSLQTINDNAGNSTEVTMSSTRGDSGIITALTGNVLTIAAGSYVIDYGAFINCNTSGFKSLVTRLYNNTTSTYIINGNEISPNGNVGTLFSGGTHRITFATPTNISIRVYTIYRASGNTTYIGDNQGQAFTTDKAFIKLFKL